MPAPEPQVVAGAAQLSVHMPLLQTCAPGQTLPHVPQLFLSVRRLRQMFDPPGPFGHRI